MRGIIISEIHADRNRVCAFLAGADRLATAYRQEQGRWLLKMPGETVACDDFDCARDRIQQALPGQPVVFERRTIQPRHHYHGRLSRPAGRPTENSAAMM